MHKWTSHGWTGDLKKTTGNWKDVEINIVQRNSSIITVQKSTYIHAAYAVYCLSDVFA